LAALQDDPQDDPPVRVAVLVVHSDAWRADLLAGQQDDCLAARSADGHCLLAAESY